jgi:hypothetical protein
MDVGGYIIKKEIDIYILIWEEILEREKNISQIWR